MINSGDTHTLTGGGGKGEGEGGGGEGGEGRRGEGNKVNYKGRGGRGGGEGEKGILEEEEGNNCFEENKRQSRYFAVFPSNYIPPFFPHNRLFPDAEYYNGKK